VADARHALERERDRAAERPPEVPGQERAPARGVARADVCRRPAGMGDLLRRRPRGGLRHSARARRMGDDRVREPEAGRRLVALHLDRRRRPDGDLYRGHDGGPVPRRVPDRHGGVLLPARLLVLPVEPRDGAHRRGGDLAAEPDEPHPPGGGRGALHGRRRRIPARDPRPDRGHDRRAAEGGLRLPRALPRPDAARPGGGRRRPGRREADGRRRGLHGVRLQDQPRHGRPGERLPPPGLGGGESPPEES